jgi:hypothetical protein
MTFPGSGLITESLEAGDTSSTHSRPSRQGNWHHSRYGSSRERILDMMKTLEAINEAIRNPKHPFRKTDSHPKKAVKHRYERRKIREYLQLTDWLSEEAI